MNLGKAFVTALVALALTTAACGDSKDDKAADSTTTTASATGKNTVLSEADNGSTQKLSVGQEITIGFQLNGGTGYEWQVTGQPDAKVITVVSSTTSPVSVQGADAPKTGAPELSLTKLRAVGAGTTKITMTLQPPGDQPAAETFTVTLVVT